MPDFPAVTTTVKSLIHVHTRSQWGKGTKPPKKFPFVLCFKRRFPKQNTFARLKSKYLAPQNVGLATPLLTFLSNNEGRCF